MLGVHDLEVLTRPERLHPAARQWRGVVRGRRRRAVGGRCGVEL
ncbi:hypothetical protein ACFPRL_19895 [Pseudoclavibacter helvolus]